MAKRKPQNGAGFDIGFGVPSPEPPLEQIDQGLASAFADHASITPAIIAKITNASAQPQAALIDAQAALRVPMLQAQQAARLALGDIQSPFEAMLVGATEKAFAQSAPVRPAVPDFAQAVAAATGVTLGPHRVEIDPVTGGIPLKRNVAPDPGAPTGSPVPMLPSAGDSPGVTAGGLPVGYGSPLAPVQPVYQSVPAAGSPVGTLEPLDAGFPTFPDSPAVPGPSGGFPAGGPSAILPTSPQPTAPAPIPGTANWPVGETRTINEPRCGTGQHVVTLPWRDTPVGIDQVPWSNPQLYQVQRQSNGFNFNSWFCANDETGAPVVPPPPPAAPPPPGSPPPAPAQCPPCQAPAPPPVNDDREIKPGKERPGCDDLQEASTLQVPRLDLVLSWLAALVDDEGKPRTPGWLRAINVTGFAAGDWIASFIRGAISVPLEPMSRLLTAATCGGPEQTKFQAMLWAWGFLSRWLGIRPEPLVRPVEYQSQYLCPTELPTAADANAAFLADKINAETWECWTRANGVIVDPAKRVRDAQRARLAAGEIIRLHRRGDLTDAEFKVRLREIGFTDDAIPKELLRVSEALPGPADIIRFLSRDTADPAIINRFGLDSEFEAKWQGELVQWAKDQGLPTEAAKHYWRAHWDVPPPSQLYEMYHRFSRLDANDPRYTSLADVETALKQDDKLPFWIPRLLGIAEHQINPSDAYKARQVGTMGHSELVEVLQQNGYSADNAERIAKSWDAMIRLQHERLPLARLYLQWAVSRDDLFSELLSKGLTSPEVGQVLARLDTRRKAIARQKCQRGEKRRYMLGEWTDPEAVAFLLGKGLDAETAQQLVGVWKCERDSRGKTIGAGSLCGLLDTGVITSSVMYDRLSHLGYDHDDAMLMVASCSRRVQKKMDAAEARAIKARETAARQLADRLKKQQRQQQQQQQPQVDRMEKCRKAVEGRDRNYLLAASLMAPVAGEEIYDSLNTVKDTIRRVAFESQRTEAQLAQAAVTIARGKTTSSWEEFERALKRYAEVASPAGDACDGTEPQTPIPPALPVPVPQAPGASETPPDTGDGSLPGDGTARTPLQPFAR